MAIATKLEPGQVVKLVNKPEKEISTLEGNTLSMWKRGERKDPKTKESLGFFEAEGTTQVVTEAEIAEAEKALEKVGTVGIREMAYMFNQVSREDLGNKLNASIAGAPGGLTDDEKRAKALVKVLKSMDAGDAKKMVKAASGTLKTALTALIESDPELEGLLA